MELQVAQPIATLRKTNRREQSQGRERRQNDFQSALTKDVSAAENIQSWWDLETYGSLKIVVGRSMKELQAQKMLRSTTKFTGERCKVGMLLR